MTIFRPWRAGQDVGRLQTTTLRPDDLTGADDLIAELALARRALQRHLADGTLCGRRFTHSRRPMQFDARGYLVTDACSCLRPTGHDRGCLCEHDIEHLVYRVDDDGREHYSTRPFSGLRDDRGR
jgi:hypothetical protein